MNRTLPVLAVLMAGVILLAGCVGGGKQAPQPQNGYNHTNQTTQVQENTSFQNDGQAAQAMDDLLNQLEEQEASNLTQEIP